MILLIMYLITVLAAFILSVYVTRNLSKKHHNKFRPITIGDLFLLFGLSLTSIIMIICILSFAYSEDENSFKRLRKILNKEIF